MIIFPVPARRPCIRIRARFPFTPGLSDSYLSRMALTVGVIDMLAPLMAFARLLSHAHAPDKCLTPRRLRKTRLWERLGGRPMQEWPCRCLIALCLLVAA